MTKGSTTKAEARKLAKIRAQGRIRRLRGKVQWEGDLEQSRQSRIWPIGSASPKK